MSYKLRILSLGAGVQSSTLYLMAERGEIEPFDCAIFADTGWEGAGTYAHLEWLQQIGRCPIIVVRSARGSIFGFSMEMRSRGIGGAVACMPFFSDGDRKGMLQRQCTDHFKIRPIRNEIRRLLGLKPRQRAPQGAVEECVGISLDEARRMKISRERMSVLSYPLVDMRMYRHDCENWLARNYAGLVVPKSACVGCPFHSNHEWRQIQKNEKDWRDACALDASIRDIALHDPRLSSRLYLHAQRVPLEEVDLRTAEDKGQMSLFAWQKDEKLNLFVNKLSIYE